MDSRSTRNVIRQLALTSERRLNVSHVVVVAYVASLNEVATTSLSRYQQPYLFELQIFLLRPHPTTSTAHTNPSGLVFFGYRFGYVRVFGPRRQTILRFAESWR